MKKFKALTIAICAVAVLLSATSCSAARYATDNNPQVEFDATEILYNQYPTLVPFYEEGVLKVTALVEKNGVYDIKYKFVKYRYTDYGEMIAVIKERFPELYNMYSFGLLDITSLYKYVDTSTMTIRYKVGYRRVYDFYYHYVPNMYPYGGYRYDYRPRTPRVPRVSPPPTPRPTPNNGGNRPGGNGGPRPGGGNHGGGRPGGGPRR